MGAVVLPRVGLIRNRPEGGRRLTSETSIGRIQIQRRVACSRGWIVVLGPEAYWRNVVAEERQTDFGGEFPAILPPKQIAVQESLKVVVGVRSIEIVPFLSRMNAKPEANLSSFLKKRQCRYYHLSFDAEYFQPRIDPSVCRPVE